MATFAIEFWMRADTQAGDAQLIQAGEVAIWLRADGQLMLTTKSAYNPTAETSIATNGDALNDNVWHHVALNVLRQGAAAVYVDGVRTLTTNASNVSNIATNYMILGARRITVSTEDATYSYDRGFKGQLDEVRIWDATLNADKLSNNRKVRLTGSEDGLVAYYPFEKMHLDTGGQVETIGNTNDLTGTGHTAKSYNISDNQEQDLIFSNDAPALRTKPTETNVSFSYVASDTKIVITLDEDPAIIEGCTLNFVVKNVRDVNGNISNPISWSAFVNQKELEWKEDVLEVVQASKTESTVTATIVNKGGAQQMWTLSGMPSWLKVDAEYGSTNPTAESTVSFTVSESTPIGKYEATVYLRGNNGIEVPLTIRVKVTGEEPAWQIEANKYEFTMNLIGSLNILGVPSEDTDDIVSVFIDDECRGIAHIEYDNRYDSYFVTMDIYGNDNDADKPLEIKVYDASVGIIYPVVRTTLNNELITLLFGTNDFQGRYDQPVVIDVLDMIEESIDLAQGWNWISLGVTPDDSTVPAVFAKTDDKVSLVKQQDGDYMEYDIDEWVGPIITMNNVDMYLLDVATDVTLKLAGHKVDAKTTPIPLVKGWNWVAFHRLQTMSVGDALADWEALNDDIIKGHKGVAYFNGYEWVGSLKTLVPGRGYMIQSAKATSFKYPSTAPTGARLVPRYTDENTASQFAPVDYHQYPQNMALCARVVENGLPVSNVELGVFAGDECREAAFTDSDGMVYMTIPGNDPVMLSFRIAEGNDILVASQTVLYTNDGVCGTLNAPFVIDISTATSILEIAEGSGMDMPIYDVQGRKISENLSEFKNLPKGVYIINGQKVFKK